MTEPSNGISHQESQLTSRSNIEHVLSIGELIKLFGGWVFGAVVLAITVMLWIQSQGNDKYYPKLAGDNLEKQIARIEQHMDGIEHQNLEIIRILGRIEGSQAKDASQAVTPE